MCDSERVKSENEIISLHYILISGRCAEKIIADSHAIMLDSGNSIFLGQNGGWRDNAGEGFQVLLEGVIGHIGGGGCQR